MPTQLRRFRLHSPETAELFAGAAGDVVVVDLSLASDEWIDATLAWCLRTDGMSEPAPVFARIPALGAPTSLERLDRAIAAGVSGILLPLGMGGQDVTHLDARISVAEAVHGRTDGAIDIVAEAGSTAQALFGLGSYRGASHRLRGLVWDAEALAADLGLATIRDPDGRLRSTLAFARAQVLFAARAAGVTAIAAVAPGSPAEAEDASAEGFGGLLFRSAPG